jgi:hypothetical protein
MERTEIRDSTSAAKRFPDCASLHPGYEARQSKYETALLRHRDRPALRTAESLVRGALGAFSASVDIDLNQPLSRDAVALCPGRGFDCRRIHMFSNASYVLILAVAALATTDTASAGTAAHASPKNTIGTTRPKVPFALDAPSTARGFVLRQDLFDRAAPNNVRSDWPAPPAQPGQF